MLPDRQLVCRISVRTSTGHRFGIGPVRRLFEMSKFFKLGQSPTGMGPSILLLATEKREREGALAMLCGKGFVKALFAMFSVFKFVKVCSEPGRPPVMKFWDRS